MLSDPLPRDKNCRLLVKMPNESSIGKTKHRRTRGTARESVKRMLGESRIVVGTPGSLQADPIFEANRHDLDSRAPFGLLVLDRAEELTEHDFVRLTKLAARWVLVGDVSVSERSAAEGRFFTSHTDFQS